MEQGIPSKVVAGFVEMQLDELVDISFNYHPPGRAIDRMNGMPVIKHTDWCRRIPVNLGGLGNRMGSRPFLIFRVKGTNFLGEGCLMRENTLLVPVWYRMPSFSFQGPALQLDCTVWQHHDL